MHALYRRRPLADVLDPLTADDRQQPAQKRQALDATIKPSSFQQLYDRRRKISNPLKYSSLSRTERGDFLDICAREHFGSPMLSYMMIADQVASRLNVAIHKCDHSNIKQLISYRVNARREFESLTSAIPVPAEKENVVPLHRLVELSEPLGTDGHQPNLHRRTGRCGR
eukprot:scaffold115565_cov34-Prasinocladus_malaysianus.AAC.2